MKIINLFISVVLLSLLGSGCATVTRGTKDVLVIESEPAGADVQISNGQTGKTPVSFKLPRKSNLNIIIEKEGYEPVEVNIIPKISGAGGAGMAGNILIGGLIGAAVDAGTGSMYNLQPNPVHVILSKLETNNPEVPDIKSASDQLIELEALNAKGLITNEEYLNKIDDLLIMTPAEESLILLENLKSREVITEEYYQECRAKCLIKL